MDQFSASKSETPILRVRSLSHSFNQGGSESEVLTDVSLNVNSGEMVAVVGPSGSGKSTLLLLIAGIEQLQRGTVSVSDVDIATLTDEQVHEYRRQRIGLIFQNFNLLGTLTALENVSLPLELGGMPRKLAAVAAKEALSLVEIDADACRRFPDQLSGGQQQRVAIARSIVGERQLILADEPTGALDVATGREIIRILRERVSSGAAAVIVTHDPQVAASCDRVVNLLDGKLLAGMPL